MLIGGKFCTEIIITAQDGEVLAVISDKEIIEKDGVTVALED